MNFRIKILFLLFILSSTYVQAQVPLSKIERNYQKYLAIPGQLSKINPDSLILVKFNRALNPEELSRIKPKRQFSLTHFVVSSTTLDNLSSAIVYQAKANSLWKATDKLSQQLEEVSDKQLIKVRLVLKESATSIPPFLLEYNPVIDEHNRLITLSLPAADLKTILQQEVIVFADVIQTPKEELVITNLDPSVNEISALNARFPGIDGKEVTMSLKEGMFDTDDLDLLGKYVPGKVNTIGLTNHATTMATLISGHGNSFIKGLGVAPESRLSSSDFTNLLPDELNTFKTLKVNIQNHSYGTDLESMYGIEAAAYDKQVYESENLIHVFSAGNKGTNTPGSGIYKDIENRANLTGNFKQAKNILVIGGINRENITEILSSKGPAYDGRVKPDLVALGEDGTSGAAALTSGVIALFEQQYQLLFGKLPSSALVRSILINSADDLGIPQVDYIYGFGKMNALQSLNTLVENRYQTGTVSDQQEFSFPIQVPANQKELKVTLVWNDPPAAINSPQSIVNHLDLSLQTPAGETILPWVLSTYPHIDSLSRPAVRKTDNINTVQQLSLDNLIPGSYTVHIKGRKVLQAKQDFAIAYSLNENNTFSWTFPEQEDHVFAAEINYLRWHTSFSNQKGMLYISYDDGTNWTILNNDINLSLNFYKWNIPDFFGRARLKMEINGQTFQGKSFIISKAPLLKVGYNCNTDILLHWSPEEKATGYTLYHIKDNKLVPLMDVTDTLAIVKKTAVSKPYFAMAVKGKNFTGLKSYTIDYNQQGVSCYIRTFMANISGDQVSLDLVLASTYNLKRITWEKQTGLDTFTPLTTTDILSGQLVYQHIDANPRIGVQHYRLTFETADGLKVRSEILTVNFLKENDFLLYPNPVESSLNIVTGDYEEYNFELFNIIGQKVFHQKTNGNAQFDIAKLATGLYIGVISRNGKILKKVKVLKK